VEINIKQERENEKRTTQGRNMKTIEYDEKEQGRKKLQNITRNDEEGP